ncbi:MAG: peptidoglycan DD-metalloendopeptidase family protein [bacterium]|nr:peptidoglycan DD-metalloendopeptidase family protein [bacterium]
MKKNFFKFGLEYTLLLLVICSAVFGLNPGEKKIFSSENRYMSFLASHENLNRQIVERVKTESISVAPQETLVQKAQASSLDLADSGLAQAATPTKDNKPKSESLFLVSADNVLIKPNFATKDAGIKRDIQEYTVEKGDSVSKIASSFGVSIQTITYENKLADSDYLKPGQVLSILPTTGIKHVVKSGETIESIAKTYKVDAEAILEFNVIEVPEDIDIGEELIIPDAKIQIPEARKSQIATYNRVDIKRVAVPGDFVGSVTGLIWPLVTRNITQYFSSRHKGVDISNGERPQFWAAGSGIVELSGWDGGYGRSVVLNHGNGVKTRYGHASELYVTAGDNVEQGQVIGRVGNTGRSYGRTGNHLHFEVIKSGGKVDPLKVTK